MREQAGLHLLGNFEFLGGATFGFEFFGDGAALGFDLVRNLIETDEGIGIAVGILEAGKDATPNGSGFRCGGRRVLDPA